MKQAQVEMLNVFYDVNGAIGREVYRDSCFHKCFAKACQFVYCDAAHLKNSE